MLNSLRNQSGSLWAKLMLALLVLSFGVWGIEDMLRYGGSNAAVATVGGVEISQAELYRATEREGENIRKMLGKNYTPELLRNLGLHTQALNKMINGQVLVLEARRIGLLPSDDDVARAIRTNPAFADESGKFSKQQFLSIIRNNGLNEHVFAEDIRHSLSDETLKNSLGLLAPVTESAVQQFYAMLEEERSADLLVLPLSAVRDVGEPDEETLKNYHAQHGSTFTAPETRSFAYVMLKVADMKPAAPTEEEIKAAYDEHLADFQKPERREVEQLLFADETTAQAAHEALKGGKPMADVARELKAVNANRLSLGLLPKTDVIEQAREDVFSLKPGEFTEPVNSAFGWHIFRVTRIEPPQTQTLDQVRDQLVKELASHGDENALNKIATDIIDALAGGATMEEAAQPHGLKVVNIGPVNRVGENAQGQKVAEAQIPHLLDTVFKLEEKTESGLTQATSGTYFIVRTETVSPEHVRPLGEVRPAIIDAWQKSERLKKLGELAQNTAKEIAAANNPLERAAQAGGSISSTGKLKRLAAQTAGGKPLPPDMVDELFALQPGKPTQAYMLGGDSYAIAILRDIDAASKPSPDSKASQDALADIRASLEKSMKAELIEQYVQSLRQRYDVTINESVLQQMMQQQR